MSKVPITITQMVKVRVTTFISMDAVWLREKGTSQSAIARSAGIIEATMRKFLDDSLSMKFESVICLYGALVYANALRRDLTEWDEILKETGIDENSKTSE